MGIKKHWVSQWHCCACESYVFLRFLSFPCPILPNWFFSFSHLIPVSALSLQEFSFSHLHRGLFLPSLDPLLSSLVWTLLGRIRYTHNFISDFTCERRHLGLTHFTWHKDFSLLPHVREAAFFTAFLLALDIDCTCSISAGLVGVFRLAFEPGCCESTAVFLAQKWCSWVSVLGSSYWFPYRSMLPRAVTKGTSCPHPRQCFS